MPRVKLDCVVSFSSEDPDNPASSLLSPDISHRKWLGSKGDSSHSVVLQLCRSTRIHSVTIGSHHAALVEVLVGRSEKPNDPFKVLVLSSIFMTPAESKKEENVSKVRTFKYDQLSSDTRDQSWDRIRVVCLQPYNKHVKYGLSFVHIFEEEGSSTSAEQTPAFPLQPLHSAARFKLTASSSDDEDSFKPGELFAKLKNTVSVDAQIRQASKPNALTNTESPARLSRIHLPTHRTNNNHIAEDNERASRDRDNILYEGEEQPNAKIDKIIQRDREEKDKKRKVIESRPSAFNSDQRTPKSKEKVDMTSTHTPKTKEQSASTPKGKDNREVQNDATPKNKERKAESSSSKNERTSRSDDNNKNGESSSKKRSHSDDKRNHRPSKRLKAGPRTISPHRLMSDVVFVMSGYQNPQRAVVRDKALAMGARYERDWRPGCTHLVCAFPNTPKLRQVRSSDDETAIVTAEWIEQCCQLQRRLPWQWFATELEHRVQPEPLSDDEEPSSTRKQPDSDCDTDDEIQKVLDQQKDKSLAKHKQHSIHKREIREEPNKASDKEDETRETRNESGDKSDKTKHNQDKIKDEHGKTKHKQDKTNDEQDRTKGNHRETRDKPLEVKLDSSRDSDVSFVRDERIQGNISISDSETDEYTDEEPTEPKPQATIDKDKCLPDFFEGFTFVIDKDLGSDLVENLRRYIVAYGGEIVEHISEDSAVDYVVTASGEVKNGKTAVHPNWIWRCHKKQRKVSTKDFTVDLGLTKF